MSEGRILYIGKTGECPYCHKQFKQLHRHLTNGDCSAVHDFIAVAERRRQVSFDQGYANTLTALSEAKQELAMADQKIQDLTEFIANQQLTEECNEFLSSKLKPSRQVSDKAEVILAKHKGPCFACQQDANLYECSGCSSNFCVDHSYSHGDLTYCEHCQPVTSDEDEQ